MAKSEVRKLKVMSLVSFSLLSPYICSLVYYGLTLGTGQKVLTLVPSILCLGTNHLHFLRFSYFDSKN